MAIRTEIIRLKKTEVVSTLCHASNNLYNEANYVARQEFFATNKWIRYNELYHSLKKSNNYKALPAQTAQQTLRLLDKNWKSFFRAIKDWKKNPLKYLGRPKLPKYRKKNGENLLVFTNQQVRRKGEFLYFPKNILRVKTSVTNALKGARILPRGTGYSLEVLYEVKDTPLKVQKGRVAAIDLGINNLITLVNNIGKKLIVVNGREIKSINQRFNKEKARLQSVNDLQKNRNKTTKRMFTNQLKRSRQIKDRMHKASRIVVNWLVENDVDSLVVGYNEKWKQKVNIGRKNNQQFVNLPFFVLLNQLRYKCRDAGIHFFVVDEAYTSKCSFLDGESVQKHAKYKGCRVRRGLFRSAGGVFINADVNAAYNVLIKVFPNAFAKGIVGVGLHPERYNLIDNII